MPPSDGVPVPLGAPGRPAPVPSAGAPGRLRGSPLELLEFPARTVTNPQFLRFDLGRWDRFFLPRGMAALCDDRALGTLEMIEDDNRTAILPEPVATVDGLPFYLSVKGVGSSLDPFSHRRLDRRYAAELSEDADVRARLSRAEGPDSGGIITGELWLRGSPYGGQGLEHAETGLAVCASADLTNLAGFRIAPIVKVAFLPSEVERRVRTIHWYRRFPGRLVQELRLVPSNVRVYFHARTTLGQSVGHVFDLFGVDSAARAHRFQVNFVRSTVALLTLFARTLEHDAAPGRLSGLDFEDVWLDKDAVVAPDGTVFFVDLEGIRRTSVERADVREKADDQVYRSLYEFMFAYEQIANESARRFGEFGNRKRRFESVLAEALRDDPFARVLDEPGGVVLETRNPLNDESLYHRFSLVDR